MKIYINVPKGAPNPIASIIPTCIHSFLWYDFLNHSSYLSNKPRTYGNVQNLFLKNVNPKTQSLCFSLCISKLHAKYVRTSYLRTSRFSQFAYITIPQGLQSRKLHNSLRRMYLIFVMCNVPLPFIRVCVLCLFVCLFLCSKQTYKIRRCYISHFSSIIYV
jgi:hypothetical protein